LPNREWKAQYPHWLVSILQQPVFDVLIERRLDKGKTSERMRRKANGLNPDQLEMAAGLPSELSISRLS
jgi:hypothetical protein